MAQSVRYLTLALQGHEIHNEEMNMTIHRELNHLNAKLVNEIQALHKEIMNLTNIESADINRLEAILSVHQTNLYYIGIGNGNISADSSSQCFELVTKCRGLFIK